jgi:CRP-like cAMP-binding protein
MELKNSLIGSCDLFNGSTTGMAMSRRHVVAVIRRLTPTIAIPEEVLFSQREKGTCMHFLSYGTCTKFYMSDGDPGGSFSFVKLGRVHDGDYFGEIAFFEVNNTRTYSIKTDSHCHLETLSYTDLATLMKLHLEIAEQVQASARMQARLLQDSASTGQHDITHKFEDKYDRISKEKEQREKEKEQREREQREKEQREKEQREREQLEKSPATLSPLGRYRTMKKTSSSRRFKEK